MRTYESSLELLDKYVKNKNLKKHMYCCAASMEELAKKFNEDIDIWKTVGLLHDIDYELTEKAPDIHGKEGRQILIKEGYPPEVYDVVEAHVGHVPRDTMIKRSIYSVDPLTGLIVACVLITPEKKLENIDVEFVKKRMKEKRFAANASRQPIYDSVELGITMEEFIDTVLKAMKNISDILGL